MIVHNVHLYSKSNYLMDSPQKECKYTPDIHVLQGQSELRTQNSEIYLFYPFSLQK